MKYLTKLTSLLVLTAGLAAAPLAAAEPGHDDGPHPEHQSPHMKKPVPRPPEARKYKAEHPMKKPLKHAAKKCRNITIIITAVNPAPAAPLG